MLAFALYIYALYHFNDSSRVLVILLVFCLEHLFIYITASCTIDYFKSFKTLTTFQKILCGLVSTYTTVAWLQMWLSAFKIFAVFFTKASMLLVTKLDLFTLEQVQILSIILLVNKLLIVVLITLLLFWLVVRTTALYFIIPNAYEALFGLIGGIIFVSFFIIAGSIVFKAYSLYSAVTLLQYMSTFSTFKVFIANVLCNSAIKMLFDKNTFKLVFFSIAFILIYEYLFYIFFKK